MNLLEQDMNTSLPGMGRITASDFSTTEVTKLMIKKEYQKKTFAQLLHLNISINTKILKTD